MSQPKISKLANGHLRQMCLPTHRVMRERPSARQAGRVSSGGTKKMQTDPAWKDNLMLSEYFHGDNGAAIGAFHRTGWTGLIADLILRHGAVRALGDVLRGLVPREGHSHDQ